MLFELLYKYMMQPLVLSPHILFSIDFFRCKTMLRKSIHFSVNDNLNLEGLDYAGLVMIMFITTSRKKCNDSRPNKKKSKLDNNERWKKCKLKSGCFLEGMLSVASLLLTNSYRCILFFFLFFLF